MKTSNHGIGMLAVFGYYRALRPDSTSLLLIAIGTSEICAASLQRRQVATVIWT